MNEVNMNKKNESIRATSVRVIDMNGNQLGIMPTVNAIKTARESGLDLVEVSPTANPPVCKIMDYSKFRFDKQKREKNAKQTSTKMKELKFSANISDHDYSYRIKHATEFLDKGHKVKMSLRFRGREMSHQSLGFDLFNRIINDLASISVVEARPKLDSNTLILILAPKKAE